MDERSVEIADSFATRSPGGPDSPLYLTRRRVIRPTLAGPNHRCQLPARRGYG